VGRHDFHVPVMVDRVVDLMRPLGRGVIVDGTFGGGGHARALLEALPGARIVALDRDPAAAAHAAPLGDRVSFHLGDFRTVHRVLEEEGIDEIDGALLDLGVSSHQLDVGERGFSYRARGPLDMRMGPDAATTAHRIVNEWDEADIARILRRFGEERFAGRIAVAIVRNRPIVDTAHLAEVVAAAVPGGPRRRGHPARRSFQAIRIAVNDELAALTDGLDAFLRVLRQGGRMVVISYHSLEDRIVKRRFAAGARSCVCPPELPECRCGGAAELRPLTPRVERPDATETELNPRSRSARLRAVERR
jgi:16S rRNA (cytosine1402-N4)-methyltransferase